MKIFLIRHAHAVDETDDPLRPLSKRGRGQVRTLARFLKGSRNFQPTELWQSPLARSQETTTLLARRLGLNAKRVTLPELEAAAGIAVLATRLKKRRQPVALIGHEPHLSALVSLLVTGSTNTSLCEMKKGAILALEKTGSAFAVSWLITPELIEDAGDA